ncbi:MAG: efflux RND transporter periplasmic adaptor subunit [Cyanobacteria bacterium SZAS-4]|nr:efflux RND transporter periplasmic adaptor subunit [Cyanobacteria bacterium SZAS-4]
MQPASLRSLNFVIEATGQLQANASAVTRISAPVSGKVNTIKVSLGEVVKSGQLLASITSQEVGAMITDLFKTETEIESDLSRDILDIDCELEQTQAELILSQKQYERTKLLVEEKVSSLAELERTRTHLEKDQLSVTALEKKKRRIQFASDEKRRMAHIALEQKLTLLGMPANTIKNIMSHRDVVPAIPIQTPQAGFVLERNVNLGELVDPSRTLFVVDDIDTLWLVADIFEQDIAKVSSGQEIQFTVDSYPKEKFRGKLDFVAGTINPETRTLAVRALIANPSLKLKPKMFARMKIIAGNHTVLALPKSAIETIGSNKLVYVQKSDTIFEERRVHIGEESSELVEIVDGIKPGERVVVGGSFALHSLSLKQTD